MTMLLVLGTALVILSLGLVSMALGPTSTSGGITRSLAVLRAMTDAPQELTRELDKPFADRIIEPLQARALTIGRRLSGQDTAERIQHRLDVAGNPPGMSVDRIVSGKVLLAVLGLLVGLALTLVLGTSGTVRIVMVLGGLVLGFMAPNLFLYQKGYERSERMIRELPDAIDLLTISVESGLGFDAAVQQVARNTDGPLSDEFSRLLREMQIGMGRAEALRAMGERTSLPDVRTFIGAMVQADAFGIPVSQVLRVQSAEMRMKRRQRAEEKAQQVPVKMTVPLIFCILPCLFIAVMGPAVISLMGTFK
jgi:tight adherence protein C